MSEGERVCVRVRGCVRGCIGTIKHGQQWQSDVNNKWVARY